MKIKNGYHKLNLIEPLILEPEDWTAAEWATLCKICDLPVGPTERIVLHVGTMEFFENAEKPVQEDAQRTYIVTERCPHCESEIEMRWNTDAMGFKAFCPVCGKRLMLCDECRHAENSGPCDYNSRLDFCRHNPPRPAPKEVPSAMRVETPLGAIIVRAECDPEHPGVWIDLRRPDADQDMPLAIVEFSADDTDFPDGDRNIITRVWGDSRAAGYTDRVVHKNIEEYFATEEAPK